MGHSMSDPGNYRTRTEIEKYQERDPIKLFTESLKEQKVLTDERLALMEGEVREEVERSARSPTRARSPPPKNFTRTSTRTR